MLLLIRMKKSEVNTRKDKMPIDIYIESKEQMVNTSRTTDATIQRNVICLVFEWCSRFIQ
jgi:hypothetical protein